MNNRVAFVRVLDLHLNLTRMIEIVRLDLRTDIPRFCLHILVLYYTKIADAKTKDQVKIAIGLANNRVPEKRLKCPKVTSLQSGGESGDSGDSIRRHSMKDDLRLPTCFHLLPRIICS